MCEHKRTQGGIICARVLNAGREEASEDLHSSLKDAKSGAKKERHTHMHTRARKRRRTRVAELPVRRAAYRAASLSEAELTAGVEEEEEQRRKG